MIRYNSYFADVSSAQPHVNMHDYADAGHVLIMIKATEGDHYVNPYHRGQSLAAGMRHVAVVHYHFARPDLADSPEGEAAHFLSVALPLAGPHDFLVLDLERATPQGWSHDPSWSRAFDQHVRDHSRFRCIVYASRSVLQLGHEWLAGEPYRVHDAAYSSEPDYAPPGYQCVFRQYTDGIVGPHPHWFAGIGECDGNRMSRPMYTYLTEHRS